MSRHSTRLEGPNLLARGVLGTRPRLLARGLGALSSVRGGSVVTTACRCRPLEMLLVPNPSMPHSTSKTVIRDSFWPFFRES